MTAHYVGSSLRENFRLELSLSVFLSFYLLEHKLEIKFIIFTGERKEANEKKGKQGKEVEQERKDEEKSLNITHLCERRFKWLELWLNFGPAVAELRHLHHQLLPRHLPPLL